jgi:hypothetical protein
MDKIVLVAVMLVWLRYSVRVVSITRAYPGMKDLSGDP